MRTTKRFTPTVLARFVREGRGTGIYEDYVPWHKVSRGDPASSGRSHLVVWRQRFRELLSDGELFEQLFAIMVPDLDDCTEQFPLSLERALHPLTAYGDYLDDTHYPGTRELAVQLGIKHPSIRAKEDKVDWVPSTDFLLVIRKPGRRRSAIAVAYKPGTLEGLKKRQRELLALEREYWICRNVPWLLITPSQYERCVALTLCRTAPWSLDMQIPAARRLVAAQAARKYCGYSLTFLIAQLAAEFGERELAQRALWQAIWRGELPVDLRRGWRPHEPLKIISLEAFHALNPIISGRSAWI
ncbi:TnsA endonuclease N-terminal domain-containing protein [Aromatoleum toluclasticum]|uniref:TnsA endonuclease N-terminal domain-containing protein n=1 Tax=Aromatoleum toluclasticum TaxID=92003 RepID=UPI001D183B12|nr:TnsA endonuclease N-terminal domain-containing protein [Aromatoleum toluclasticum]MCC4118625.1 TnsA endonuclease N-terminal domain-containing protein [Aromatoleum toluclasticum]